MDQCLGQFVLANVMAKSIMIPIVGSDVGSLVLQDVGIGFDAHRSMIPRISSLCPRQDSNLRTRLRRPALYPLSYGGVGR